VSTNEVDPPLPNGEKAIYMDFGDPKDFNPSSRVSKKNVAGYPMAQVKVGIYGVNQSLWLSF